MLTLSLPYIAGHTQASCGNVILKKKTFLWTSLGLIIVVEQTMITTDYLNVIVDNFSHYTVSIFRNGSAIFVHDNALY